MPARQTRSSKAAAKARETPSSSSDEGTRQSPPMNGSAAVAHNASDKSDAEPKENIFLFWPNVIGYWRIVLAIASLYYMPLHPRTCSLLYSISCLLDALDGYAARIFEQSTRFGAVLDMVTDRCTTSCLLVFLSSAFPRWAIIFQSLIALDFSSHYMHMYATLVVGGADSSHKNIDKSQSRLLNLYYSNKNVLFVFCALNELFFIALYLLSFSSPLLSPHLIKSVEESSGGLIQPGVPVNASLLRQLFPDPFSAAALEIARANKMDSNIPWALAGLSFPVMAMKQFINVVQLVKASRSLAEVDIKSRKAKGLPRKVKAG
ncbi:CDP-diacylglycerol--inositol 3-phosphatidyltransferase [Purpureocillium takamizusanense]|uniref:CDP-diacylglycerol--inositol 3-phosphatidyltransferase n=1 Tax=Purpureocillium takamizusanense TaxID=2060973 RepID=A0A9Q8QIS5_9HYPO|nr:CDP-diacylglycerol--inositol 3-phosphatidyltransferase [Purpureocillium takamizusanense]UNI20007.1 CDP-diacylglycerol--inositol 3-phosphatidyltransferase [Purpureocillium takamizusanense]